MIKKITRCLKNIQWWNNLLAGNFRTYDICLPDMKYLELWNLKHYINLLCRMDKIPMTCILCLLSQTTSLNVNMNKRIDCLVVCWWHIHCEYKMRSIHGETFISNSIMISWAVDTVPCVWTLCSDTQNKQLIQFIINIILVIFDTVLKDL